GQDQDDFERAQRPRKEPSWRNSNMPLRRWTYRGNRLAYRDLAARGPRLVRRCPASFVLTWRKRPGWYWDKCLDPACSISARSSGQLQAARAIRYFAHFVVTSARPAGR